MKKCLKITFIAKGSDSKVYEAMQAAARDLELEGTAQVNDSHEIIIIVCGAKEKIDNFLDKVHEGFGQMIPEDVQIEPFLKEKDYRGIFRILE